MQVRSRVACISAAVAAFMWGSGGGGAQARDLIWDWSPGDGVPNDGTGDWNTTSPNWVDSAVPGVNTTWNNSNPDSAIFGGGALTPGADPSPPYNVNLSVPITVQNLTLAEVPSNAEYSISNFGGGPLTLNGNLIKSGNDGFLNFFVDTVLSAGNHTVTLRDTPNDGVEFIYNGVISGGGGLTLDNDIYEAWGTLGFNQANSYSGVTNINKGRVLLTNAGGLGATGAGSETNIGSIGTLAFYGAGTVVVGNLNITEPITITRSQYSEHAGTNIEFGRYDGAIQSNGGQNTISGAFVLNTTDARIQVNGGATGTTDGLTISSNITETTPSKLSKSGGGVLFLTGTNTYTGGTATRGGTIAFTTDANIGGPNSQMFFDGGYFRIPATWTNFGTHVVDYGEWAGGLDTPGAAQVFVIANDLTGTNFNKRGVGTVNLNGTSNVFTGNNFTDLGTVNINGNTTSGSIRIRNGVVNINAGATYTTTNSFTNIGQDTGENGTLNVMGTLTAANQDFNVSDNAGTTGTMNVSGNALVNIAGPVFVGKSNGAVGTLNISDNAVFNANRGGNPSFVIGRGTNATGTVNKTGGTLAIAGELFVGNDGGGTATFTQSAGSTTVSNWLVVGRNTSTGTLNLNGGTLTKQGGGNTEVDFGGGGQGVLNIRNNAVFNANTGEFWVGSSGGSNGVLNMENAAALTTNNWTVFGRGGGSVGTLNMSGTSSITKATGGGNHFIIGDNGTATANVTQNASINVTAGELWVGQAGSGNGTLNIQNAGAVSVGNWLAIGREGGDGFVNLSGTGTLTKTGGGNFIIGAGGGSTGILTQTGGTITNTGSDTWIAEGAPSGIWNMSGGSANLNRLDVGRNGGGTATLNMSGTASIAAGIVRFGEFNTVSGTVNLDGGALQATQVVDGVSSGAAILNLNGGTLKAGASNTTDWMTTGITANVKAGGAILDSNGFDATVNSPLIHDPALGATPDGGLTKSGLGTFTLTGTNTYNGGTTVNAGTLQVRRMHENNAVTIAAGAKLQVLDSSPTLPDHPAGDNAFVSRPSSLTIAAGGTLDLGNNDLILDYTAGSSPAEAIEDLIALGFNGGGWDGTGIISSTAAQDPNFMLAVADNAALLQPFGNAEGQGGQPFAGQDVDLSTVLVKFTHRVDLDLDGLVTSNDAAVFNAFFSEGAPATWQFGDLDYDGVFSSNDAAIFNGFYNEALASLPEPSMGVGLLGLLFGMGRRRSRRAK